MKKFTIVLVLFVLFSCEAFSQKVDEYGLRFSNFYGFGLMYKTGSDNALYRFSGTFLHLDFSQRSDSGSGIELRNLGVGFAVGRERRRAITDKLKWVHGPEFSISVLKGESYNQFLNDYYNETRFSPELGYILGLNYAINDNFLFSAELIPSLIYTHTINPVKNHNSVNFGLNSGSALLTLAYRIMR